MIWQGNYAMTKRTPGAVIYQTDHCPDLVLVQSVGRNWIYWNPPFFSPVASTGPPPTRGTRGPGGAYPSRGLIADIEPYVLACRATLKLLQKAGRSPFDPRFPLQTPLAVHYWRKRDGSFRFLLGNLERAVKGGSQNIKLLWLDLTSHFVTPNANEAGFSKVTQRVPGLEVRRVARDGEGHWRTQVPVWPMGSCVWDLKVVTRKENNDVDAA